MARVVRGRFLSLRQEDFVTAAELAGASQLRIIFRHMVPSFLSHIIAATSLALPAMIIAETSLSFLGLGLARPRGKLGCLAATSLQYSSSRHYTLAALSGHSRHRRRARL